MHASHLTPQQPAPTYGPLVPTCAVRGIGRSNAFKLAAAGTLDTFKIGAKRYVLIESLESLPERLRAAGGAQS